MGPPSAAAASVETASSRLTGGRIGMHRGIDMTAPDSTGRGPWLSRCYFHRIVVELVGCG